jgi:hypothetical protein
VDDVCRKPYMAMDLDLVSPLIYKFSLGVAIRRSKNDQLFG